jgi:hypothetical protein
MDSISSLAVTTTMYVSKKAIYAAISPTSMITLGLAYAVGPTYVCAWIVYTLLP